MSKNLAIFFLLVIPSSIFASDSTKFRYYVKIDGIYGFKNLCPSTITFTPVAATATTAATQTPVVGTALIPAPTIPKSYVLGGAMGFDWGIGYRTELSFVHFPKIDYSYTNSSNITQQFKYAITSLMANLILELPGERFVMPFGNIGAGYSRNHLYDFTQYDSNMNKNQSISNGEIWNFSWQVGGGLTFRLNYNMDLDLGYRYMYFDRLDSGLEQSAFAAPTVPPAATPTPPTVTKLTSPNSFGMVTSYQFFLAARIYF